MYSRLAPALARMESLAAVAPASSTTSQDQTCTRSHLKLMRSPWVRTGINGKQHRAVNAWEHQRARLVLLVGRPDNDEAAVGAGDRAADEDEMVLGVDLDDVEVANGALGVAVLAGSL